MAKAKVIPAKAKAVKKTAQAQAVIPDPGTMLVPVIKSSAMSTDVGPRVVAMIADAAKFDREASELQKSRDAKRYDAMASITQGIVKAAKADNTISLASVFLEAKSVDKARLNNQLYLALGLKAPMSVKGKMRFAWSDSVAQFVEPTDANDPYRRQKDTVRTNLAHMLTKCVHAAIHIVDSKIDVKADKESGTLMLSGPSINKHFGEASVLLNEKQTVKLKDKKGNVIGEKDLKARPSFTEIARLGAEAHGKVFQKRVDSRAVSVDPNKHIADLCGMLVKALEKAPAKLDEKTSQAILAVQSAIDTLLG